MNHLFTNAPLFVPSMKTKEFEAHDLERRVAEAERKQSVSRTENEVERKQSVSKTEKAA
jgi:hypothetical protein